MKHHLSNKESLAAISGYILFVIPWLVDHLAKNHSSNKLRYHAQQATGLFVLFLAMRGLMSLLILLYPNPALMLFVPRFVFLSGAGFGILHVLRDEKKPLPFIGEYTQRLFK